MNKLNDWLSFGANMGVILGIVFLAVEINQNNELMEAEARFNRLTAQAGSHTILAENGELAGILTRVNRGEILDDAEELRVFNYNMRAMSNMQWAMQEVPEEELPVTLWITSHRNAYRSRFWEEYKGNFTPAFVAYYDENVAGRVGHESR